ncbi:MAG: hypothetical protein R2838_14320 [Caldilineaceae bacterium]
MGHAGQLAADRLLAGAAAGRERGVTQEHLRQCRELSFSFLYWMQTDASRHDGKGYGYPACACAAIW